MQKEYDIDKLNPRKNPHSALIRSEIDFSEPLTEAKAPEDYRSHGSYGNSDMPLRLNKMHSAGPKETDRRCIMLMIINHLSNPGSPALHSPRLAPAWKTRRPTSQAGNAARRCRYQASLL